MAVSGGTSVEATLRRLLVDEAGVPEQVIVPGATFDGDLMMDSMSFVSLQVELETELGVDVTLDELRDARTVEAAVRLLEQKVGKAT